MRHYVIIDGVLTLSTPDVMRWMHRVSKAVPAATEEPLDAIAVSEKDSRSDFEIIQSLDELDTEP